MQASFWVWQCSDRSLISLSIFPPPPYPLPNFSLSLISLMVSVDVKHHVYLLTTQFTHTHTHSEREREREREMHCVRTKACLVLHNRVWVAGRGWGWTDRVTELYYTKIKALVQMLVGQPVLQTITKMYTHMNMKINQCDATIIMSNTTEYESNHNNMGKYTCRHILKIRERERPV